MDSRAAGVLYSIVECIGCGRELAVNIENGHDEFLCADCDRIVYRYMITEDVLPIEPDDCEA